MICTKCLMDDSDPEIRFDSGGVCNHCVRYEAQEKRRVPPESLRRKKLQELVSRIQESGRKREYDCVIGVSGGVDSTYVAFLCNKLGLRPLAVHFDNGWNSELAVSNIEKTLKTLKIDLHTEVVDWDEFRSLQLSFLYGSTPDGEVPTDHAIVALLYRMAARIGVKYIILGTNVASEAVMPLLWGYGYSDFRYINSVNRQFLNRELKTYPHYSLEKLFFYRYIKGISTVSILDYIDYKKEDAMKNIESELGWVYYGGKHYESIYTRFYQSYVLPRKFNIDKRRAHLSNLVLSGQIERSKALSMLEEPLMDTELQVRDKEYVIKKLDITNDEFEKIMKLPLKTFRNYPNDYQRLEMAKKVLAKLHSFR